MENSMEVPEKTKNKTTAWSSNSSPRYISQENKNTNSKRYTHRHVHCSITYNSLDTETTCVQWWMDKYTIYTQHSISHTKQEMLLLMTTWMDLEDIMLSEINQRKPNTIWSHLFVGSKNNHWKKWTQLQSMEVEGGSGLNGTKY